MHIMKHYTGILTLYVMNIFTITAIYSHGVRSLVIGQKRRIKIPICFLPQLIHSKLAPQKNTSIFLSDDISATELKCEI